MPLTAPEIEKLATPLLLEPLPQPVWQQLLDYLDLLNRWNSRMNLTAVRDPRLLASLHLGECLRAAQMIPADTTTVLDYGSGAGLPGIPIQIARPDLAVTLAESQTKKATFLREAVRTLDLRNARVHSGRVEELTAGCTFDLVAMRAVDRMDRAIQQAASRADKYLMLLISEQEMAAATAALPGFAWVADAIPRTDQRVILLGTKAA